MLKRIADFPLSLGSIVYLVLIEMDPDFATLTPNFIYYFLTFEGGKIMHGMRSSLTYGKLLDEYLTDPVCGEKYVLDGPKYALVARFLLDCFIQPSSEKEFLRQVVSVRKISLKY